MTLVILFLPNGVKKIYENCDDVRIGGDDRGFITFETVENNFKYRIESNLPYVIQRSDA